jgi:hypothetical protein
MLNLPLPGTARVRTPVALPLYSLSLALLTLPVTQADAVVLVAPRNISCPYHRRRRSRAALNRPSAVPVAATGRRILSNFLYQNQIASTLPSLHLCTLCYSASLRKLPLVAPERRVRISVALSLRFLPDLRRIVTDALLAR